MVNPTLWEKTTEHYPPEPCLVPHGLDIKKSSPNSRKIQVSKILSFTQMDDIIDRWYDGDVIEYNGIYIMVYGGCPKMGVPPNHPSH